MKIVIITAQGEVRTEDVERIDYELLSNTVKSGRDNRGFIEAVFINGPENTSINMYLNEEGKLEDLPFNERATKLATIEESIGYGDYIVGDVVLVGGVDAEGDDTGLEPEDLAWIEGMLS